MPALNKTDVVPVLPETGNNFNTAPYVCARKEEYIMI